MKRPERSYVPVYMEGWDSGEQSGFLRGCLQGAVFTLLALLALGAFAWLVYGFGSLCPA